MVQACIILASADLKNVAQQLYRRTIESIPLEHVSTTAVPDVLGIFAFGTLPNAIRVDEINETNIYSRLQALLTLPLHI